MHVLLVLTATATLILAALTGETLGPRHNADEPAAASNTLTAVSLNMARETDASKVLTDLNAAPRLRAADVFLFQEVASTADQPSVAEQVAHKLNYSAAFSPAAPGVTDQGLAIVSRYPLRNIEVRRLKFCDLRFRCRSRFALSADVLTPWGGVRVYNAHLDTRINSRERLEQLQPVIDAAAKHPGAALIGGDFNTNELRWLGNMVPLPGGTSHGETIRYAMAARGFATPFDNGIVTFPVLSRQLDWIFVRNLQPIGSSVEPVPFSDHHAIWTRLAVRQ